MSLGDTVTLIFQSTKTLYIAAQMPRIQISSFPFHGEETGFAVFSGLPQIIQVAHGSMRTTVVAFLFPVFPDTSPKIPSLHLSCYQRPRAFLESGNTRFLERLKPEIPFYVEFLIQYRRDFLLGTNRD